MSFTVKADVFEGPLELLLDLIESRKLFINDISLARVTDDFIEHLKKFDDMPMGESAHFILVASTLLLIKSKSLLPELTLTEEEHGNIQDLETRLKIYKRIKEAGSHISRLFGVEVIFPQSHRQPITPVFTPDLGFSLEQALQSLRDMLERLPKNEKLPKVVVEKVVSLEEMIDNLTTRITRQLKMSFKQFTAEHRGKKVHVIVSFLAMLELVKQGVVHVSQESHFKDIHMETKEVGVPKY